MTDGFLRAMNATISPEEMANMMPKSDEGEVKKKRKKVAVSKSNPMPKKVPVEKEHFEAIKPDVEMMSVSEHDEKMKKLQTKYDKLDGKYKDLNETHKKDKAELTKVKKALETEKKKREVADGKLTDLSKELSGAKKEISTLKKNVKTDDDSAIKKKDGEIAELKKELKKKEGELKDKDEEISSLQGEKDTLSSEKKRLAEEIESLKKNEEVAPAADEVPIITRISATEFQSTSFNSARYRVQLSRDCRFMTFRVDIMGSAVCNNGVIALPKLAGYIPFTGQKDYKVQSTLDGEMCIDL